MTLLDCPFRRVVSIDFMEIAIVCYLIVFTANFERHRFYVVPLTIIITLAIRSCGWKWEIFVFVDVQDNKRMSAQPQNDKFNNQGLKTRLPAIGISQQHAGLFMQLWIFKMIIHDELSALWSNLYILYNACCRIIQM